MPRRSIPFPLLVMLALAALPASKAQAQTVRLGLQGIAQSEGLGRAFEAFSVFGGVPGIAAARYDSDFNLNTFQLPMARSFAPIGSGWLAGVSPYAELTLGYLTADQRFPLNGGAIAPNSVKLSFNAWSALAGVGFEIPIASGLKLRTIGLAGYSHVDGNADFAGPNADFFRSAVRGILSDASLNSALIGGALELVSETRFRDDVAMIVRGRYNQLAAIVTSASDPSLKQDGNFGVANAGVTLTGPTDWRIAARPIRWIGYANGTWLPNIDRGVLGFNAFAELGGGLQLVAPGVLPGVKGGTVRAAAIVGPGVTGWLVSAALNF